MYPAYHAAQALIAHLAPNGKAQHETARWVSDTYAQKLRDGADERNALLFTLRWFMNETFWGSEDETWIVANKPEIKTAVFRNGIEVLGLRDPS